MWGSTRDSLSGLQPLHCLTSAAGFPVRVECILRDEPLADLHAGATSLSGLLRSGLGRLGVKVSWSLVHWLREFGAGWLRCYACQSRAGVQLTAASAHHARQVPHARVCGITWG